MQSHEVGKCFVLQSGSESGPERPEGNVTQLIKGIDNCKCVGKHPSN